MASAVARRLDIWRRSLGLCCICGQPLASPRAGRADGLILPASEDPAGGAAMDSDARLLTEETAVRLALLRFNALGDYQFAHVVDTYTFLQDGRREFRDEFNRHWELLRPVNPAALDAFKATVVDPPDSPLYSAALAAQRRAAERLTVPSCRRCNKAMDRTQSHTMAVLRCAPFVLGEAEGLELSTQKALAARKVLQQMALYFSYRAPVWAAKSERKLLEDAALWRCIAHLSNWGSAALDGSGARFRMIAHFHAAHWLFMASNPLLSEAIRFDTWHQVARPPARALSLLALTGAARQVFREFLMSGRFEPDTFFGMRQVEVARRFDLSRRDRAPHPFLHARLNAVASDLYRFNTGPRIERAIDTERAMAHAGVVDEDTLLRFLVVDHQEGSAARFLLRFFAFQLQGSNPFFGAQCQRLASELERSLKPPPRRPPSSSAGPRRQQPPWLR